jgi:hypothetical protein
LRTWLPHSTYSGIESSSIPMKIVTRFSAPASRIIPPIEPSIRHAYSPGPVSRSASERHDTSTARMPVAQQMIAIE